MLDLEGKLSIRLMSLEYSQLTKTQEMYKRHRLTNNQLLPALLISTWVIIHLKQIYHKRDAILVIMCHISMLRYNQIGNQILNANEPVQTMVLIFILRGTARTKDALFESRIAVSVDAY